MILPCKSQSHEPVYSRLNYQVFLYSSIVDTFNSSKKWVVTWMILRHWPTHSTPLSLTCFFISEKSWIKIEIRRFLCSRFRPINLWNVFLSVWVHSFIKLMGEGQKKFPLGSEYQLTICPTSDHRANLKRKSLGIFLVVQWLRLCSQC